MKEKEDIEDYSKDDDLILLARMARRRKDTPLPDIDQEWTKFSQQHLETVRPVQQRRRTDYRLFVSALLGAAAMLAFVLLFDYLIDGVSLFSRHQPYIALQHDSASRNILLKDEHESTLDLSGQDSISYYVPVKKQKIASAAPVSTSESVQPVVVRQPDMQHLSTPRGMDFKVVLSDGSEVWLNAESEIEFPSTFISNERHVKLKGEAYFKVARNESSPFIVESGKMRVRVLGTEFNVSSYEAEPATVALVKGSVEVENTSRDSSSVRLMPGEQALYHDNGEVEVGQTDVYAVQQWVNGFFYFDNKPLIEILRSLGRWYNYGVIFNSTEHMHKRLHFSIQRNESVENAIVSLQHFLGIHIELKENNIIVS